MKHIVQVLFTVVVVLLSGCATITTGTDQSVTVITEKDIQGAKCKLADSKGRIVYIPETPGTASIHKGDGPMNVTCEKEGFKTVTVKIEESFQGATLGNIILGGGIGIIVDVASGSAQKYPDLVIVWMEPEEWSSEEERLDWLEAKRSYEEELQARIEASQEAEENGFSH
jgi:hypothetical protein